MLAPCGRRFASAFVIIVAAVMLLPTQVPAQVEGSAAPPIVGQEIALDLSLHSELFDQGHAAVASNGRGYLVSWIDAHYSVRAALVGLDGELVDPFGLLIGYSQFPSDVDVAWTGEHYLVVWQAHFYFIRGARVGSDGTLLDPEPFTIARGRGFYERVDVASNGTTSLVAWTESHNKTSYDISIQRISNDGTSTQEEELRIPGWQLDAAVEAIGDDFFVAWRDDLQASDIHGVLLSEEASITDTDPFEISSARGRQSNVELADNGSVLLAIWQDARNAATRSDIFGARITSEGALLDPDGFEIESASGRQVRPVVTPAGERSLVAWTDLRTNRVGLAFVGSDGAILGRPSPFPDVEVQGLASSADKYLIVGRAHQGLRVSWVEARLVDDNGSPLTVEPTVVSFAVHDQDQPTAAWNGSQHLIAWRSSNGESVLKAARVSPSGEVMDPVGVHVAAGDLNPPLALETNGQDFMLAWTHVFLDRAEIRGARVSSGGDLLDPMGIQISTGTGYAWPPLISWNGSSYLVAWSYAFPARAPRAVRISPEGVVVDAESIRLGERDLDISDMASNGHDWLLIDDNKAGDGWEIHGRIVEANGTVRPATLIGAGQEGRLWSSPKVAWNGKMFLVVWSERGSVRAVRALRVDEEGVPIDTSPIELGPRRGGLSVVPEDEAFVVTWRERHGDGFVELRLARVEANGEVTSIESIEVPVEEDSDSFSFSGGEGGQLAIVYEREATNYPFNGAFRSFLRLLEWDQNSS